MGPSDVCTSHPLLEKHYILENSSKVKSINSGIRRALLIGRWSEQANFGQNNANFINGLQPVIVERARKPSRKKLRRKRSNTLAQDQSIHLEWIAQAHEIGKQMLQTAEIPSQVDATKACARILCQLLLSRIPNRY